MVQRIHFYYYLMINYYTVVTTILSVSFYNLNGIDIHLEVPFKNEISISIVTFSQQHLLEVHVQTIKE